MWGDARLVSVLVLFLLFLGYIALRASIEDEAKGGARGRDPGPGRPDQPADHQKYSVEWWNTLHQGESILRAGGPALAPVYLTPLLLATEAGYSAAFGALWLERIRAEVWRRRATSLALRAALA